MSETNEQVPKIAPEMTAEVQDYFNARMASVDAVVAELSARLDALAPEADNVINLDDRRARKTARRVLGAAAVTLVGFGLSSLPSTENTQQEAAPLTAPTELPATAVDAGGVPQSSNTAESAVVNIDDAELIMNRELGEMFRGFEPGQLAFGEDVNWEANPREAGAAAFSSETLDQAQLAAFLAEDSPRANAAREYLLASDMPQADKERALRGEGLLAVQALVPINIQGTTYFVNGEAVPSENRSVETAGDIFLIYVDEAGHVHGDASFRSDCGNINVEVVTPRTPDVPSVETPPSIPEETTTTVPEETTTTVPEETTTTVPEETTTTVPEETTTTVPEETTTTVPEETTTTVPEETTTTVPEETTTTVPEETTTTVPEETTTTAPPTTKVPQPLPTVDQYPDQEPGDAGENPDVPDSGNEGQDEDGYLPDENPNPSAPALPPAEQPDAPINPPEDNPSTPEEEGPSDGTVPVPGLFVGAGTLGLAQYARNKKAIRLVVRQGFKGE